MNKIAKDIKLFESRSMHGQMPIIWESAKDEFIYSQGKKYIDFTSTIFVTNIGHANSRLKKNIIEVLDSSLIHTYNYMHRYRAKYLKKLINFSKPYFDKAYLVSAGTEATEAALKVMRLHGISKSKKKKGIIALNGNWHGRTMGAQLLSGNEAQKEWIGFKDPNIFHIDFPYPWSLKKDNGSSFFFSEIQKLKVEKKLNFKEDIAGFMLETFQGWGAIFYPQDFIDELKRFCKKNEILICFDEMQAGFGRTGKKFGFEHYNIKPDLICIGKGMGSGLPISGVLGKGKLLDIAEIGSMSSTHSANPLSCAAGLATISEIENKNLVKKSYDLGIILKKELDLIAKKYNNVISNIFSKGLIASIVFQNHNNNFTPSQFADDVCHEALSNGLLLVRTGRESIKIGPPLIIKKTSLLRGIKILDYSIQKCLLK